MQSFSRLAIEAKKAQDELNRKMEFSQATAFPEKLLTESHRKKRLRLQKSDYNYFRDIYFPPEVHTQGYYEPGVLQEDLPDIIKLPGLHIVLGPRGYAKTVTALMAITHEMLNGETDFLGTYSETVDKARNLMNSIAQIIQTNPRINADWAIKIEVHNDNEFRFRVKGVKKPIVVKPYSPERSVRGAMQVFDRIKKILADDVETEISPTAEDSVDHRRRKIEEAYKSLAEGGTMIVIGNNYSEDCVLNKYLMLQDENKLTGNRHVHIYPAWDEDAGALWPERYPAYSESELQALHGVDDEAWSGDYQQRPEKSGGMIFPEKFWQEYDKLPSDVWGVVYCDPNLAIKIDKSDYTVIGGLGYSPSTNLYYAFNIRCKPMDDIDELLMAFFKAHDPKHVALAAFDGWVDQEAVFTNFVRLWCHKHRVPMHHIEYQRINVDMQMKNVQMAYTAGRILFPSHYEFEKEGQSFKKQITKFKGKKRKAKSQKVDAADWLVCAYTVLHDPKHYFGEGLAVKTEIRTFGESFNF